MTARCDATNRAGGRCANAPMHGATRCRIHGDVITSFVAANRAAVRAEATVARIKALHVIEDHDMANPWCASDKMLWPCPTIKAIEGEAL